MSVPVSLRRCLTSAIVLLGKGIESEASGAAQANAAAAAIRVIEPRILTGRQHDLAERSKATERANSRSRGGRKERKRRCVRSSSPSKPDHAKRRVRFARRISG